MADIEIRTEGRAGRVTLNRPEALNALTYEMCRELDAALRQWHGDAAIGLVIIDAAGARAFCAGGDIVDLYAEGRAGHFEYGQRFWRDEYRMNARIADYPKPVITLMQGFTMGGGVGVGCHASHRIVGLSSQIAMPECGIGLVPDVGGSYLLARAPGALGTYLGTTGARMGPGDAIYAGFADVFVPEADWPRLVAAVVAAGSVEGLASFVKPAPASRLAALQAEIDALFAGARLNAIMARLRASNSAIAADALKALSRVSPLSAACAVAMQEIVKRDLNLRRALELEYRVTYRAQSGGDFLEGIRAAIIDKDRKPRWRHASAEDIPAGEVEALLAPLGPQRLSFEE